MIRDFLRRLRRRPPAQPVPLAATPPPAGGAITAGALLWWRQQGDAVACVDLRPLSALRYGFVDGALLLPAGQPDLVPRGGVVVYVGQGAPVSAWQTTDLTPWEAAGYPLRAPAWKSPLPLLHPVRTRDGAGGWIQDVDWAGDRFVYTVVSASGERRAGLEEEDLTSRGPRGAAGLGEQL